MGKHRSDTVTPNKPFMITHWRYHGDWWCGACSCISLLGEENKPSAARLMFRVIAVEGYLQCYNWIYEKAVNKTASESRWYLRQSLIDPDEWRGALHFRILTLQMAYKLAIVVHMFALLWCLTFWNRSALWTTLLWILQLKGSSMFRRLRAYCQPSNFFLLIDLTGILVTLLKYFLCFTDKQLSNYGIRMVDPAKGQINV